MLISFIWREPCFKFLIEGLLLILCKKMGRFSYFFQTKFSTFDKTKTKTYIKNLRHSSLHMNVVYMCLKLYTSKYITKRDILDQKIHVE